MKTIILIEGQNDIDIILNNKSDKENKIISFDYNSTKILNEMKLESDSIDNYFKKSDPELIDKSTVNFTQNWYKACNKKNELDFRKINLGFVIEAEIVRYFLFILRRILGIVRILEKEKPEKIICSSLEKFVKNLCNKQNIIIQSKNQKINSELEFSNIEIPINMGFKKILQFHEKIIQLLKK